MANPGEHCYMTLVMSDSYLPGAMILAHSLKDTGASKPLVALVTLDTVSRDVIEELKSLYTVISIDSIANPKPANLYLMGRPDLLFTFTKIAIWRQTQYSKVVYMDADTLAIQNLDHLFQLDLPFAAAPDIGWPDCFNSGFMVMTPNMGDYYALETLAKSGESFDGADQGLLNQYYQHKPWHRLSFAYNMTQSAEYQWQPAYRFYKPTIKAVHFIGKDKPWLVGRAASERTRTELVGQWWAVYDRHYKQSPDYVPGKSYTRSTAVQKRVFGEQIDMYYGLPEEERLPLPAPTEIAPTSAIALPPPELHFSPPSPQPPQPEWRGSIFNEWDATRAPPPSQSRPEAENFPSQQYTFDNKQKTFRAPEQYPQAPTDMWFSVPEYKPDTEQPPPPIFPWEKQTQRPKATRIFSEDLPPSPQVDNSWANSAGGMDQYIKNIFNSTSEELKDDDIKRESLMFTGLPDPSNRPSLPVTPAPIPSINPFDDLKLDEDKELPQAEWDPTQSLEALRKTSLVEMNSLTKQSANFNPNQTDNMESNIIAPIPSNTEKAQILKFSPAD